LSEDLGFAVPGSCGRREPAERGNDGEDFMTQVRIYGSGCAKCQSLAANVNAAARELGIDIEIEKVTDLRRITEAGVLMTPGLEVDGEMRSTGHLLSVHQLKALLG
jgi:small redox-active disulfide protein 2